MDNPFFIFLQRTSSVFRTNLSQIQSQIGYFLGFSFYNVPLKNAYHKSYHKL